MKKRTVIWLLACVVVLIAIYALVLNWSAIKDRFFPEELKPYEGDGTVEILAIESNDCVTRLDWSMDGKQYTIFRNENDEYVSEDANLVFDQEKVRQDLISALSDFRAGHVLTDVNPADYGLDEPWLSFTVYDCGPDPKHPLPGDGNVNTVYVGMFNKVTETYYATLDFETIYLLESKLPERLGPYQDYLVKEYAPEGSIATYMSIEHDGEVYEYTYPQSEAEGFYSVVFSWYTLDEDGMIQPVNVDSLSGLYDLFSEEKWTSSIDDPEDLSVYGLDDPMYRVVFRYFYTTAATNEAGIPTQKTVEDEYVLLIGDASDETHYYAMKEGSPIVRTLAVGHIEELLAFDPESMYVHYAVVPEWQSIRSMDITLPDGTTCLCEIRPSEDGKSFTYFIDGFQVAKDDVRNVFLSMYNPGIDGIDPEANRSIEDAEIKVHFSRERDSYQEMDLYLIPYNSALYVVDFAGQQQYLISKRVVDGIIDAVATAKALTQ